MDDNLAQLRWQESVGQAVQDLRLLVDAANDLWRDAGDAERATEAYQYHQFGPQVDGDELIRLANNLKHDVGARVSSLVSQIHSLRREVAGLGETAPGHVSSV